MFFKYSDINILVDKRSIIFAFIFFLVNKVSNINSQDVRI